MSALLAMQKGKPQNDTEKQKQHTDDKKLQISNRYCRKIFYICLLLSTNCCLLSTAFGFQLSSLDSLFVRASTGEIKYLEWNEPARDSFVALGKKAIPYLLDQLDTDDAREQWTLIEIFKKIKNPAVKPLILKAKDGDRAGRVAVYILGEIGDTLAVTPLLDLLAPFPSETELNTAEYQLKANCLLALGKLGDRRASPKIIPYLKDTILGVRRSASIALSKLGDPLSTEALVEALSDSNYAVRCSAEEGLIKIGRPALNYLIKILDTAPPTNYLVIHTLGEIGDKRAIPSIKPLLNSDDPKLRGFAVEALGKLSAYKPIKGLQKKERDKFVKTQIEEALKHNPK